MTQNIPNLLTLGRIAVIPIIVALLFSDATGARLGALLLYILASLTDLLDGWIARRLGAQSNFGTMLDPIADKLVVAAVMVMLVARGAVDGVHVIAVLVILGREILISGLRDFLASEAVALPVSRLAKWKTAMQMIAIGAVLAFAGGTTLLTWLSLALLWLATCLSLITAMGYLQAAWRHLAAPVRPPQQEPGS